MSFVLEGPLKTMIFCDLCGLVYCKMFLLHEFYVRHPNTSIF